MKCVLTKIFLGKIIVKHQLNVLENLLLAQKE